jgi:hypothetical protein
VVKKLEEGETAARVKLLEKDVPKAISEEINMSLEKGKDSISHVVSLTISLCHPRTKREKGKGGALSAIS